MPHVRVMLVDPEALVRRGLQMRLALEADLTVIGGTPDPASAASMAAVLQPEVIVLDAGLDGLCAAIQIVRRKSQAQIVVLSLQDDSDTRRQTAAAGAVAFVGKQETLEVLLEAVRRAAREDGSMQRRNDRSA